MHETMFQKENLKKKLGILSGSVAPREVSFSLRRALPSGA